MSQLTEHVKNVCRIGQGSECCRYLVAGSQGFECMKLNAANKKVIDTNWAQHPHVSQGDNCEGRFAAELN